MFLRELEQILVPITERVDIPNIIWAPRNDVLSLVFDYLFIIVLYRSYAPCVRTQRSYYYEHAHTHELDQYSLH